MRGSEAQQILNLWCVYPRYFAAAESSKYSYIHGHRRKRYVVRTEELNITKNKKENPFHEHKISYRYPTKL